MQFKCVHVAGLLMAAMLFTNGGTASAKESAQEICKNQLLTYRQRYLCQQELDNIQTKADEKAVVRKFNDLIRAAQKEKEEGK